MSQRIASLRKNSRETIHVALDNFKGFDLVSIRVFVGDGDDEKPTKAGLNIRVATLPAFIEALTQAATVARTRGLLNKEGAA